MAEALFRRGDSLQRSLLQVEGGREERERERELATSLCRPRASKAPSPRNIVPQDVEGRLLSAELHEDWGHGGTRGGGHGREGSRAFILF